VADHVDLSNTEERLATELLEIHRESYGKGASAARVHILDDLVVCLLDDIELLPNEEFMVTAGQGDAIVEMRSRFQLAIETTFRAAVERATGRRVVSFASNTKLDDVNWVIETFRLGPIKQVPLPEEGDD
jgi:uncharacterized protein YbcI